MLIAKLNLFVVKCKKRRKKTIFYWFQSGLRALHFAARNGNVELALILLARGADVDAATMVRRTGLYFLCNVRRCVASWPYNYSGVTMEPIVSYQVESSSVDTYLSCRRTTIFVNPTLEGNSWVLINCV